MTRTIMGGIAIGAKHALPTEVADVEIGRGFGRSSAFMASVHRAMLYAAKGFVYGLLVLGAMSAHAATVFVSQSGGSVSCGGDGTQTTTAVASVTWTAGNTYKLCGTITSAVAPNASGTSGSKITILWESNAAIQNCSTVGSLNLSGKSWFVIDMGGTTASITCPNNGTGLSTSIDNTVAISDGSAGGMNNIEVSNGQIGPEFIYTGSANLGFGSTCFAAQGTISNIHLHNLTLAGCANGIIDNLSTNTTDEYDHLTIGTDVGRILQYAASSGSNFTALNSSFHDSDITTPPVWSANVAGDPFHYEAFHFFGSGNVSAQDKITNFLMYNNNFHGASPLQVDDSTALIFVGMGAGSCAATNTVEIKFFNNVILDTGSSSTGYSAGTGGYFYTQDCNHTLSLYNNVIDVTNGASNACFRSLNSEGTTGNAWTIKNNICIGAHWAYLFDAAETLTANFNDYNSIGAGEWVYNSATSTTLTAWRTATSQDANAFTTTPGLNADFTITSTGSAVYQTGSNLTSLSLTALDTGAPQTFGQSGACGTGCVGRSASVAWDVGAFPFATATPVTPAPALGMFAEMER